MDGHVIKALFWRLLMASKRRFIMNPFCILYLVLSTYLSTQVFEIILSMLGFDRGNPSATNQMSSKSYHSLFTPQTIQNRKLDILYYPDTDDTKLIMDYFNSRLDPAMLNQITPKKSEEEMESWLAEHYKNHSFSDDNIGYGIVFKEVSNRKLSYSIRNTKMNIWHTKELFPSTAPSPRQAGSYYSDNGFLTVQTGVNMGYMKYLNMTVADWSLQEFSYPMYVSNSNVILITYHAGLVPLMMFFGMLPLILTFLDRIVNEKKTGARELLRLNGLGDLGIYGYWFIYYMLHCLIAMTICAIILRILFVYTNTFILWIFLILLSIHSFCMIFFVSSIFNNTTYASLIGLVVMIVLLILMLWYGWPTSTWRGYLSVMTPMGSLYHGIKLIVHLELSIQGLHFDNLFYEMPDPEVGSMALIVSGMMSGSLVFTLISIYLGKVKPGPYGSAKPWHFVFPEQCKKMCKVAPEMYSIEVPNSHGGAVEGADLPVGIQIHNLYKVFGALNAVNGLSIDIYKDQITVLLGHNGAGKTTLMSILTGVLTPTSGQVIVDNYNLFENMNKYRKQFGYCPQHDLLLQDLSVLEQIIFFGMVRGLSKAQVSAIAKDLMTKFEIKHRKGALPKTLSGGMKRKLCLAISLANNPKILFLDEPTSGLDPQSRRNIWDILLELRGNRTIIITTHFMEEADVLGDKIAIMAHGELRCYGTSIFLKKHYGAGHKITVVYAKEANPDGIKNTVINQIPTVTLTENQQQGQLMFNIPLEDTSKLDSVFTQLESNKFQSIINEIGVTCTSMEEVFLKVQEGEGISTDFDENLFTGKDSLVKKVGAALVFQQFWALILKRFICLRIWIIMGLLCFLIIPLFFTVITFLINNDILNTIDVKGLSLNLNQYGKTTVLVDGKNESIVNSYIKKVRSENSVDILSSIHTLEELTHAKDLRRFGNKMIVAADFRRDTPVAYFSSNAYHGAPIAIDMLFNAFINNASNQSTPKSIEITNHPYSLSTDCQPTTGSLVQGIPVYSMFIGLGVLFCMTYFVRFPITERSNGMKQLQYMSGLSPLVYWASNMLFDFAMFCILLLVLLVTGIVFDTHRQFFDIGIIGYIVLLMILYPLAMFATCYSLSFLFKSHSGATNALWMGSLILALMPALMDFLFTNKSIFHYLFHFSPSTPFFASIFHITSIAKNKFMCEKCKNKHELAALFCLPGNEEGYISANMKFLAVDLIWISLLTLALDYRFIQLGFHKMNENIMGPIVTETDTVDSDVLAEKRKVAAFTQDENPGLERTNAKNKAGPNESTSSIQLNESQSLISDSENYVLITDSLGKKYKKSLTAVYDVSFAVKKGECFGLLGVNGAGKTTTFSMLTGDIFPSRGDASIQVPSGYFTLKNSRSLFLRYIGYCPQENNITEEMTGRQLLKTFALLRGASPSDTKTLTEHWIRNLDLHLYCDKACGKYSGGNKRKLCSAIALIADPPLILMDEPTTGVDPVTKRKLWKVLKQIQLNEQTIILTSHSMDECEALCDRLTIMVAGRMRCIGNIQYLKHKFAQGFTIFIKTDMSATYEQVQEIKDAMSRAFGPLCLLKDEYKGFVHYHLGDTNYKWSVLFGKMAGIKRDFEGVDEYMVSDTSLEQVFLTLAKEQKTRWRPQ